MEYINVISPKTGFFVSRSPFPLELGGELPEVTVAYRTWGTLNRDGRNAVLICHALTGSADADEWWSGMFGEGMAFDPSKDFIICSNVLGSCYGSTGPLSSNPATGRRYGPDFPRITIRDMVRLQRLLLDELGIERLRLVVGASLGGMQVLEWGAMYPGMVGALMPMGASGRHSAWCIAQSEAQRCAITADREWNDGWYDVDTPPARGLAAARMMAMCSYRSFENFQERFARHQRDEGEFQAESYLHHQGEKLVGRFDANTYIVLTRAMDMHDLGRDRPGGYEQVLKSMSMDVEVLSISSDVLYPSAEQEELAHLIPGATIEYLHEPYGHDAFLIVTGRVSDIVKRFRDRVASGGTSAA
ncbi:homoserine O-acetyltransferase [Prosthecochloris sp. N3]|uniref:Homoserine O-acetyltransferase n=1 Tax=Prosthecochloris ethylica TaxID=2743976 RepID=A0ABR9XRR5_9CHLB|nr:MULTISPECIES: homoserine O-acetyltransferase [Prosthecochloris]MBF0586774.1 homoserine O-acetyltransferase [Prosthecochloris ethylica]MBF0636680.1 homoserine O-acetyltransferase [Prosthecochloris ethylica]NUK47921.1 homoserine O-acetyltransferase [Prosthecochloris ethylica]RNA65223.1 homoserine O-acetyltransferase [Prosthecochloris sp. ZM_2]